MGTYQAFSEHNKKNSVVIDELEHLLFRISAQDQVAFETLHHKLHSKLTSIACRLVNDPDLCDDVVQDTFIQIWRNACEYQPQLGSPMSWISSLLRNRAFDLLRIERRHQTGQQTLVQAEANSELTTNPAMERLLKQSLNDRLADCLGSMDATRKSTLLMAYYYGYSGSDISIHLQLPLNTVKSSLKRSLSDLGNRLRKYQVSVEDLVAIPSC